MNECLLLKKKKSNEIEISEMFVFVLKFLPSKTELLTSVEGVLLPQLIQDKLDSDALFRHR